MRDTETPLSLDQQASFHAVVLKALPRDINPALAAIWADGGKALTEALRGVLLKPPVIPPKGGRVYEIVVEVDESEEWQKAVSAVKPKIREDAELLSLCDQYPAGTSKGGRTLVLVNFGRQSVLPSRVIRWYPLFDLRPATAREVFALGRDNGNLLETLGATVRMTVISPALCTLEGEQYAPGVFWQMGSCSAILPYFMEGWWDERTWFAFVRE